MTTLASRLLANLNDLAESWEVRVETKGLSHAEWEWIVTLTSTAGGTHVYRDTYLERAVARAWAGAPDDVQGRP